MRAIAADMGMTAPALYRYIDSHAALQSALIEAIYDDVLRSLEESSETVSDELPGQQVLTSLMAFRHWALSRPEEFRLVFARPQDAWEAPLSQGEVPHAIQFFMHFMSRFKELLDRGELCAPTETDLPEGASALVERFLGSWLEKQEAPELPMGLWWTALRDWVVVCGVIRMEVDGLVPAPLVAEATLFQDAVRCISHRATARQDNVEEALRVVFAAA